jgi:hypothetical protein
MKNSFGEVMVAIAAVLGLVAILVVILGYPLMLLWNWLMPELFGLPEITFWQAIGLNVLSTILFRSSHTIKTNTNKQD